MGKQRQPESHPMTIPAEPGALDLKPIKETWQHRGFAPRHTIMSLVAEVEALREKAFNAYCEGWDVAHEPARCGHARANYKDPKFGTPEYKGNEKCEACAEVEALRARVAELEATVGHVREANEHWHTRVSSLKTEVEALREDRDIWKIVADTYEADRLEQKTEIEALRERVAELEGVLSTEQVLTDEYVSRAEAAEASMVELAGALNALVSDQHYHFSGCSCPWCNARGVLITTPAKALERARAVGEVVQWAGELRRELGTYRTHAYEKIEKALAKLDALGKEEG